jgi:transcriptional regulator with XRE-family HTH domain
MTKGRPADDTIGQRIRELRTHRRWSVRHLASAAGISPSALSMIERGQRSANNRYLLADLAAALECPVTDLTGEPYAPADRQLETAHRRVSALRSVLVEAAPGYPPDDERQPAAMPAVESLYALAESRADDYDLAVTADVLTQVIPDIHAHAVGGDRRAAELLVRASFNAVSVFRTLGYPGDALFAAERCAEAARFYDDPVAIAVADAYRAMSSVRGVSHRVGRTIAERAVDGLTPHLQAPGALEILGILHLTAAYAAHGQRRADDAAGHLDEAERIAERTGNGRAWGYFTGPADVKVWRVGLEVDAGNPGGPSRSHGTPPSGSYRRSGRCICTSTWRGRSAGCAARNATPCGRCSPPSAPHRSSPAPTRSLAKPRAASPSGRASPR